MLRTFLARSCQPQRLRVAPAVSGARFISTTQATSAHPEGKECYLERLQGEDHGKYFFFKLQPELNFPTGG